MGREREMKEEIVYQNFAFVLIIIEEENTTWKMPGDMNRYQIDYIMVKNRFKNQVKESRSYPEADIDSDHNLVMYHEM